MSRLGAEQKFLSKKIFILPKGSHRKHYLHYLQDKVQTLALYLKPPMKLYLQNSSNSFQSPLLGSFFLLR